MGVLGKFGVYSQGMWAKSLILGVANSTWLCMRFTDQDLAPRARLEAVQQRSMIGMECIYKSTGQKYDANATPDHSQEAEQVNRDENKLRITYN